MKNQDFYYKLHLLYQMIEKAGSMPLGSALNQGAQLVMESRNWSVSEMLLKMENDGQIVRAYCVEGSNTTTVLKPTKYSRES